MTKRSKIRGVKLRQSKFKLISGATLLLVVILIYGVVFMPGGLRDSYAQGFQEQYVAAGNARTTTVAATWPSATTSGNLLVAAISFRGGSGVTVTPPAGGWSLATRADNGTRISTAIYYIENAATQSGTSTWTLSGAQNATLQLAEYSNVLTSSALDQTATATGNSATGDSGTTSATTQNGELAIAVITAVNSNSTFSAPTNSFSEVGEVVSTGGTRTRDRNSSVFLEKLSAPTGAQNVSVTISSGQRWAGAIATFQTVQGPQLVQTGYRWFNNANSTDVGSALAAQDTEIHLRRTNQEFRLRQLLHANESFTPGSESLKLQFAEVGSDGVCDTSFTGETYIDVTTSTKIAYNDNSSPADGDALTDNANDPNDGYTVVNQTYEEANNAAITNVIASGNDALYDFSLKVNEADRGRQYCLRTVFADGTALAGYDHIPTLVTLPDVYIVCDDENELQTLDTATGIHTVIGSTGVPDIEAIAYDSGTDTLYATDAGDFGTLNKLTGAFTLMAEVDGGGCADGDQGCVSLDDIDGLAFDVRTRIIWASHRTDSSTSDLLFQIDPDTGNFVPDAFGTDVDYLVVGGTGVYTDVDDMGIRPSDGVMYTAANNGHLTTDQLLTINKATGAISVIGDIDANDFEGIGYRNDDTLMGVRGTADEYREIDDTSGTTSNTISLSSPSCGDPEGIAALLLPANVISGMVFQDDSPQNGALDGGEVGIAGVDVLVYVDNNSNGQVDIGGGGSDTLVQTVTTDAAGEFSIYYGTTVEIVMAVDTATLPTGYSMTTDNVETAVFTDNVHYGEEDTDNYFGANSGTDCDGDGIPDFDEGTGDADGDGVIDQCDLDVDNDGQIDSVEGTNDTDSDGVPDYRDLDSDNDGIPDALELNSGDASAEYQSSTGRLSGTDTDADGLIDAVDSAPSTQYGSSVSTVTDPNFDGDARLDRVDPDADDDGILDLVEAGGADSDGDGVVDGFTDTNSDGYDDSLTGSPLSVPNTDGSGSYNYRDLDSDADGIPDFREGQTTAGYTVPGIIADTDSDGIIDAFDSSLSGTSITPNDQEADGTPDYLDSDSEDDGVPDTIEGHDSNQNGVADNNPTGSDTDGDGLDDGYDTANSPAQWFDHNISSNAPVQDSDSDGERDWRDTNDDDDGFLTIDEDFNSNLDWSDDFTQGGSPTPDYLYYTAPIDLQVTKIVDNATPDEGDTIQYTITITNNGPVNGTSIEVTDLLPLGITYVSDTPSQGSYVSGTGIWTVGQINNGNSATLSISATVNPGTAGATIENTAERTYNDQGDSNFANDIGSVSITVRDADLAVSKTVDDDTPNEGQTINYTITITNNGPDQATGVELTDLLPSGVSYSSDTPSQGSYVSGTGVWSVGTINNAASATLTLTATVDVGTGNTIITNSASITASDQADSDPGNNSDSQDIDVQQADLSLTKTVDDDTPNEGDTILFTITITNSGPDEATNISVSDQLPAGLTYASDNPSQGAYVSGTGIWTIGTIANGSSATLEISATVDAGTVGLVIDNTAEVSAADQADPDSTPGNSSGTEDDEATQTVNVLEADLSLTKTVDNANPNINETVKFTITVSNAGPDACEDITIDDDLPAGLTFTSDTPSQGSYNDTTGVWTVGAVANGASATLEIFATVDASATGQTLDNATEVESAGTADPDSTPGNTSGTEDDEDIISLIVTSADLSLTKTIDNNNPNPGDTVAYTLTVTNSGPDLASNIEVMDLLPAGLSYVSDTPSQGTYTSGTGLWAVGSISNGASATLSLSATVDSSTAGQTIVNSAEVESVDQGDPDSTPGNTSGTEDDEDTASLTVTNADLSVSKTVDNAAPNEGDAITYTITITNNGPDNASGVELTDQLPSGTTYVSDTPSQGSYNSGSGVWSIGNINNGANVSLTINATVDAGTGNTIIANNATITAVNEGDANSGNDWDYADIDVQQADLSLTKIVDEAIPNVGETIQYTLTLNNANPDNATNVTVSDQLPTGITYVSDTPSQGTYNSGTGVWDVGTLPGSATATLTINATVDNGTGGTIITNSAEVATSDQADPDSTPGNTSGTEDDEDSVQIDVQSSDLAVTKIVDDDTPNEGDTIEYSITINNNGPDAATNVELTDLLPSGLSYVSSTPSQGSYVSGSGVWSVGTISVSSFATLTITATVDAGTGDTIITNTAAITAVDQDDPSAGNNTDSADIDVLQADLSLTKVVDNSAPNEAENVTYTLTLTNDGPDAGENIIVYDPLPAGVTYVTDTASLGSYNYGTGNWTIGSLPASSSATLAIEVTIDSAQAGNTIVNSAQVQATETADPDSTPGNSSGTEDDEDSASLTVADADLSLGKIVDEASPNEGDAITWTVTIVNNGPDNATGIEVSDQLPSGVTYISNTPSQGSYNSSSGLWTVGNLINGTSATLQLTSTVDNGTAATTITNTATVTASDQSDSNSTNNSAEESITVRGADLSIDKIVSDGTPNEGDTITWTLTLTNNGPDDTTGAEVTDQLPSGVTYVSDTPSQGSYNSSTGIWSVGNLNNGATATLQIVTTVDGGTATTLITNTATITGNDTIDSNTANDTDDESIAVEGTDIAVSKVVDESNPNIGETITYTITATNNGPDAATSAEITDLLPAGLSYVSDTPSQGSYNSSSGIWTIGALAASASATLNINATVDNDQAGQTITNTASLTDSLPVDPSNSNNTDSVALTVQSIDLAISKTVDDDTPNEGQTINYTISLANNGPSEATSVVLEDILPAGVTYVTDTPTQGSYSSSSGAWSVGSLGNGASATLTLTATVDSGTAGTTITNTAATSASDQTDLVSGNDSDSIDIEVNLTDLAITKIVDDDNPNAGDTIEYSITLNNNGPDNATGLEVTDLLPAGMAFVSATPTQGSYNELTGVWSIGNLNVSAFALLSITATVDADQGGNTIVNYAEITALNQTDSNAGNDQDSASLIVQSVDIAVSKSVDVADPLPGASLVYTIDLVNNGPNAASTVEITDVLPSEVSYVSDTPSQGSYNSGTGVWNVGSMSLAGTASLAITATVNEGTAGTTIANTATLTAADPIDDNALNDQVTASSIVPSPPDAIDDSAAVDEDDSVEIDVKLNDSDPDGDLDQTSVNVTIEPEHGATAVDSLTGIITYTPDSDYFGSDVLTYEICDLKNQCDSAEVNLTINSLPDPPIAVDDAATTNDNTAVAINVPENDTDVDGDLDLTSVTEVTPPNDGSISIDSLTGKITYTPDQDFTGTDTFEYQICDLTLLCDTAQVTITVNKRSSPDVTIIPSGSITGGTCVAVPQVTVELTSAQAISVIVGIDEFFTGSAWESIDDQLSKTIALTPDDGYKTVYAQFRSQTNNISQVYTLTLLLDQATECGGEPTPQPPVAEDDFATTNFNQSININVPGNDTDPDDDLDLGSVAIVESPEHGTVTVDNVNGLVSYDPNEDYDGVDVFTYRICDALNQCDEATVTVTVYGPSGECEVLCDDLTYDLYIINPDGTERHMNTIYAREHAIGFRQTRVLFEDKGLDFDYNDVIIDVEYQDCGNIKFEHVGGDASWSHEIRVRVFHQRVEKKDVLLWHDSQKAQGAPVYVNAVYESDVCGPNDLMIIVKTAEAGVCNIACDQVDYDLFIINPDGTERHMKTLYAQIEDIGPEKVRVAFEDKGDDFDYNDVVIDVEAMDCENITIDAVAGDAQWHHQVYLRLFYESQTVDVLLWPDSQVALGQEIKYTFVNAPQELCPSDYSRVVTPRETAAETIVVEEEEEDLGPLTAFESFVNEQFGTAESFLTALESAVDNFFSGGLLTFLTGNLSGESRIITLYDAITKRITVEPGFSEAPEFGDRFTIVMQDVEVEVPRLPRVEPEDVITLPEAEVVDLFAQLRQANEGLDQVDEEAQATELAGASLDAAKQSLRLESDRLKGIFERLNLITKNRLVLDNVFMTDLTEIDSSIALQNKVADFRAMSAATRRILESSGATPVVESYMTFGSLEMKFLIINPLESNQVVNFQTFLPPEVQAEHILEYQNVDIAYADEADRYVSRSETVVGGGEVFVYSVDMEDVWQIPDAQLALLQAQAEALAVSLEGSAFAAQGAIIKANIDELIELIKAEQVASFTSPQRHIIVYRENEKRVAQIEAQIDDLTWLSSQAAAIANRELTIRILVPLIVIIMCLTVIGAVGISMYSYGLAHHQKRPKKRVSSRSKSKKKTVKK